MQFDLLTNNVSNIIAKSELGFETIDALGMAEVEYYNDATKEGILQDIGENLLPGTSVTIFNTESGEIIFPNGVGAEEPLLNIVQLQTTALQKNGLSEIGHELPSGESIVIMAAFDTYPNWNWLVVSYVDRNQLFEGINDALVIGLAFASGILLIMLLVIYRLSGGVSRSIEMLEEGARKLADDTLDIDFAIKGDDEFSSLADSFTTMAQKIEQSNSELRSAIAEEKSTNRSLTASREQYQDLVESTSDIITRVDINGRFIFVNSAAAAIFGVPKEDCINRLAFDFVHPEDRRQTEEAFASWLESKRDPLAYENRQVGTDGSEHYMLWSIRAETDSHGVTTGFASSAIDITEQKNSEKARDFFERQLRQVQKMEAIGQLAGGIAHDFNNNLGVIIGHTELAQLQLDVSSPIYPNLSEIQKAAEYSAELTKQLLTFARKQAIDPKILELSQAVLDMYSMLKRLIGENINLTLDQGSEQCAAKVDAPQINQILANLCVNARDSISGVGNITIKISNFSVGINTAISAQKFSVPYGDYVLISVSDDGAGMTPAVLERVFEPFYTTKPVGKGTGLGLSTVFGAVKQNNGFIDIVSEPGEGSTFNLYFPSVKATPSVFPKQVQTPDLRGNETVLLVEDEEALLEVEARMLSMSGYKVLRASTVSVAVELAREHEGKIDLLLSDIIMPEMNGQELSVKLTKLNPQMKVLLMSGYTADIVAKQGIMPEGVQFLQKPFSIKVLSAKVREALAPNSKEVS